MYTTVEMIGNYVPKIQEVPRTSLCFVNDLEDAENHTFLEQRLKPGFTIKPKRVMYSSLNAPKIIENCSFRNFTSDSIDENIDCNSVFEIEESTRSFYQCFLFTPRNRSSYAFLKPVTSFKSRNLLYKMSLTTNMTKINRLLAMVHFKFWPTNEFMYTTDTETSLYAGQLYSLSYKLVELFRQPHPYDTQCVEERESHCFQTGSHRFKACTRHLCRENFTITRSDPSNKGVEDGIHFHVGTIQSPVLRVDCVVKIRPINFLLQVLSLLSLWLDLSIIFTLNSLIHFSNYIKSLHHKRIRNIKIGFRHEKESKKIRLDLMSISTIARVDFDSLRSRAKENLLYSKRLKFKLKVKLIELTVKATILVLCIVQIKSISIDFFRYETRMDSKLILDDETNIYPSFSYCIHVSDFFKVRKSYSKPFDAGMIQYDIESNMTLEEYFINTPPANTSIIRCRIRDSITSELVLHDDCNKFFTVTKFWQLLHICYYVKPKLKRTSSAELIRRNNHQPGILYTVVINETLIDDHYFQPIVSYDYPFRSRFLSTRLYKQREKQMNLLSHINYKYKLLPSPYDTRCDVKNGRNACLKNCLDLKRFNRIPYSVLYVEPLPKYILCYTDLRNHTIAEYLGKLEKKCEILCRTDCKNNFTKTIQSHDYSSNETQELGLLLPKHPIFVVLAIPIYTLYELIYQICLILCFWFGFSLIKFCKIFDGRQNQSRMSKEKIYMNFMVDELEKIIFKKKISSKFDLLIKLKSKLEKNIFRSVLLIICFAGYCFHSYLIAKDYFSYPVLMNTEFRFENNFTALYSTVCITMEQLDLDGNYSTKNIFAKSPKTSELIRECGYRGFILPELAHLPSLLQQRVRLELNSTLCNELFEIDAYISFGMVCYSIHPKEHTHVTEYKSKYHLMSSKTYAFFTFRYELAKYNLTIVSSQEEPYLSLLFPAQTVVIEKNHSTWYWVSYEKHYFLGLAYPYNMGVYDGIRKMLCFGNCGYAYAINKGLITSLAQYKENINESREFRYETSQDNLMKNSQKEKNICQQNCESDINYGYRQISYTQTNLYGPFNDSGTNYKLGTIGFWFRTSDHVVMKTFFLPELRTIDLVIYLGSIFSIWFGLCSLKLANSLTWFRTGQFNYQLSETTQSRLKKIYSFVVDREEK